VACETIIAATAYPWRPLTADTIAVIADQTKIGCWVNINFIFGCTALLFDGLSVVATLATCFASVENILAFPGYMAAAELIELVCAEKESEETNMKEEKAK
jgi:hypothetical protein